MTSPPYSPQSNRGKDVLYSTSDEEEQKLGTGSGEEEVTTGSQYQAVSDSIFSSVGSESVSGSAVPHSYKSGDVAYFTQDIYSSTQRTQAVVSSTPTSQESDSTQVSAVPLDQVNLIWCVEDLQ